MKQILMILLLLGTIFFVGCSSDVAPSDISDVNTSDVNTSDVDNSGSGNTQMANPASTFCVNHGGTLEIRTADDGSQSGYCKIAGKECDEWSLMRGECTEIHVCTDSEKQAEICTMEYMPVCGSDGKTYGNDCGACAAKVDYWTNGECATDVNAEIENKAATNTTNNVDTNTAAATADINDPIICCESFGYGSMMVKTASTYAMIPKSQCVIPEGYVGGGKNIVDDSYCSTPSTGGSCTYDVYPGKCTILSISKTETSMEQKDTAGYEGFEIKFDFTLDDNASNLPDYVQTNDRLFRLANSWYPGQKFLDKYSIVEGAAFNCNLTIITKGTCSPIIFKFENVNITDYFESN